MKPSRDTTFNYVNKTFIIVFAISVFGLSGCWNDNVTSPTPEPHEEKDISKIVSQDEDLETFNQIVAEAGLEKKLSVNGKHTVFAPTDSAFDKLPDGYIDSLSEEQLKEIINYHILSKIIPARNFEDETKLTTDQGNVLFVKVGSNIQLNDNAKIVSEDKAASNGVIQKVNEVLLPDAYQSVFGIINKRYFLEKFACHCTSGRTDLDDVLKNEDSEFTVFVPNDTAFMNSGLNTNELSDAELKNILSYHIINEKLLSDELSDGQTLETRSGKEITISIADDGTLYINGGEAVVQQTDMEGTNGVVYVIDSVLDPRE